MGADSPDEWNAPEPSCAEEAEIHADAVAELTEQWQDLLELNPRWVKYPRILKWVRTAFEFGFVVGAIWGSERAERALRGRGTR